MVVFCFIDMVLAPHVKPTVSEHLRNSLNGNGHFYHVFPSQNGPNYALLSVPCRMVAGIDRVFATFGFNIRKYS